MTDLDHLKILGLGYPVTRDEVKSAYRRLVKRYHPDLNPGNARAEEMMKRVTAAYSALERSDLRPPPPNVATNPQSSGQTIDVKNWKIFLTGKECRDGYTYRSYRSSTGYLHDLVFPKGMKYGQTYSFTLKSHGNYGTPAHKAKFTIAPETEHPNYKKKRRERIRSEIDARMDRIRLFVRDHYLPVSVGIVLGTMWIIIIM